MQSTKKHIEGAARSLRGELMLRLCIAAFLAGAASVAVEAWAQAPAEIREAEQLVSTPQAQAADAADPPAGAADEEREPSPAPSRARMPSGGMQGLLRRLAADLRLDAGQQQRILPILVAQREQMQRLQRDKALAPAERQRRILALGDRTADQIRAQLTDAQRAQYIKPRAARTIPPTATMPAAMTGQEVKP